MFTGYRTYVVNVKTGDRELNFDIMAHSAESAVRESRKSLVMDGALTKSEADAATITAKLWSYRP